MKKSKSVGRPVSAGTPTARNIVGLHSKTPIALGGSSKTKNTMAAISTITTAHTTTESAPTVLPPVPVAAPVAPPVVTPPPPVPSPVVPPSQPTKVYIGSSHARCLLGVQHMIEWSKMCINILNGCIKGIIKTFPLLQQVQKLEF